MKNKIKNKALLEALEQKMSEEDITFGEFWKGVEEKLQQNSLEKKTAIGWPFIMTATATAVVIILAGVFFFQILLQLNLLNSGRGLLITQTKGSVEIVQNNKTRLLPLEYRVIHPDTSIKTGGGSEIELQIIGRAFLKLLPGSSITVERLITNNLRMDVNIELKSGSILVHALPLRQGDRFIITTPGTTTAIAGTSYLVGLNQFGDTRVAVSEGKVKTGLTLNWFGQDREKMKLNPEALFFLQEAILPSVLVTEGRKSVITHESLLRLNSYLEMEIRNSGTEVKQPVGRKNLVEIKGSLLTAIKKWESESAFTKSQLNGLDETKELATLSNKTILSSIGFNPLLSGTVAALLNQDGLQNKEMKTNKQDDDSKSRQLALAWVKEFKPGVGSFKSILADDLIVATAGDHLLVLKKDGIEVCNQKIAQNENEVLTAPYVNNNVIYVGSDQGYLYAFSLNGNLLWKQSEAGQAKFNTCPVAERDYVILASQDKGLQLFTHQGKPVGIRDSMSQKAFYIRPLITQITRNVILGSEDGFLTAYNLEEKRIVWQRKVSEERILYPIVGNDSIAFIFLRNSGRIIAFRPATGETVWEHEFAALSRTTFSPVFSGDNNRLLIAKVLENKASQAVLLDALSGKSLELWEFPNNITCIDLAYSHAAFGFENGKVLLVNLETKKEQWFTDINGPSKTILLDQEYLYLFTDQKWFKLSYKGNP